MSLTRAARFGIVFEFFENALLILHGVAIGAPLMAIEAIPTMVTGAKGIATVSSRAVKAMMA